MHIVIVQQLREPSSCYDSCPCSDFGWETDLNWVENLLDKAQTYSVSVCISLMHTTCNDFQTLGLTSSGSCVFYTEPQSNYTIADTEWLLELMSSSGLINHPALAGWCMHHKENQRI